MKKNIQIFAITLIVIVNFLIPTILRAQSPDWLWARESVGGSFSASTATDNSGNIVVVGYFHAATTTFGSTTLTNMGSADVYLTKYDPLGTVLWAKSVGGNGDDFPLSLTIDADENILIVGYFDSHNITFGSTVLTNAGSSDIFVAKYDALGNVMWAKSVGGTGRDEASAITTDKFGNILVGGYFSSPTITFGNTVLTNTKAGFSDLFLAKYDNSGNILWAKSAGGSSDDYTSSVTTDGTGNIFVVGRFSSSVLTSGSTPVANAGGADIFITKYDASGDVLWAKSVGGDADDKPFSAVADMYGNFYVVGFFGSPSLRLGSTILSNSGDNDMFLAKYDDKGNVLWAKRAGGSGGDYGTSISIDANGGENNNILVAGHYRSGTITFGSTTFTNAGSYDIFLVKYDGLGNILWAKSAGGDGDDEANSVTTDVKGNIILGGFLNGGHNLTFGSTTLTNNGMYIAKLGNEAGIVDKKHAENNVISVYPNPATENTTMHISMFHPIKEHATGVVVNMLGQEVMRFDIPPNESFFEQQLHFGSASSGVYMIKVTVNGTILRQMVVVQ